MPVATDADNCDIANVVTATATHSLHTTGREPADPQWIAHTAPIWGNLQLVSLPLFSVAQLLAIGIEEDSPYGR